jgi:hypothetical protein
VKKHGTPKQLCVSRIAWSTETERQAKKEVAMLQGPHIIENISKTHETHDITNLVEMTEMLSKKKMTSHRCMSS